MRMVAVSHHREAFESLYLRACELPGAHDVPPAWRWYVIQTCLAIWDANDREIDARLDDHLRKAMREAKQVSFWTQPNEDAESKSIAFAAAVIALWRDSRPADLQKLVSSADALILAQLALKALLPGFPDFYCGSETVFLALTDPDNRRPVDWESLANQTFDSPLAKAKMQLTRELLSLRKAERDFLARAASKMAIQPGCVVLSRNDKQRTLVAGVAGDLPVGVTPVWHRLINRQMVFVGWAAEVSSA